MNTNQKFKKAHELEFSSENVSALGVYTDQISGQLGKEIVLAANTINGKIVDIRYGAIGDKYQINILKNTMYGNNSSDCGQFTSTGSTTFAAPTVQMCPISFQQSICLDTLKKYYYDYFMEKQYNTESLGSFAEVFTSSKMASTALELDKIIWQGAKSSPAYASVTGNLTLCDGLMQFGYANSATTINQAKTAFTVSNAYSLIDVTVGAIAANAPAILDEFDIFLSPADFTIYLQSLRGLNLFNYVTNINDNGGSIERILHPGSVGAFVSKVNGLNGIASGSFLAAKKETLHVILSDESDLDFSIWFSRDFREYRLEAKMRVGTGMSQPELCLVSK